MNSWLQVRIDPLLKENLRREGKRRAMSMSQLVKFAITEQYPEIKKR